MSIREYEASNVVPPLANTSGMKSQANILISTTQVSQDLTALFGDLDGGHYITFQADGAKIYVTLASNSVQAIDGGAVGTANSVCWPIPDGMTLPFVPIGGTERNQNVSSPTAGYATTAKYTTVLARVASGGVATGYLRMYRSSLAPGQGAGEFKLP